MGERENREAHKEKKVKFPILEYRWQNLKTMNFISPPGLADGGHMAIPMAQENEWSL